MSSKLRKKSKDKTKIERYIGITPERTARFKQERKEDNAILTVSTSICYMTYLSLLDTLGYKEKRLKKFYGYVSALKVKWAENTITTSELINYCEKKGFDVSEWLRSIPQAQKRSLCPIVITTKEGIKIIDSAILANTLFTIVVLKKEFKATKKNICDVLEHIKNSIDCYGTKQPVSKKAYLKDEDILQTFKEELKLDLVTGKRVG